MYGRLPTRHPKTASIQQRSRVIARQLAFAMLLVMLLNPLALLRVSAAEPVLSPVAPTDQGRSPGITALPRPLDLESRLICRQAIEEVYWRHRIWPEQNPQPKPPLGEVLPLEALRARVETELRRSNALAQIWQRPITGAQLQAEIDRMARASRQPQVLAEIFTALNYDPYLVAECLARPALADRLARSWYEASPLTDQSYEQWWETQRAALSVEINPLAEVFVLPESFGAEAQDDTWTPTPALPEGNGGSTAVWTGSEMIIWGGVGVNSGGRTNSGARYNPATDTWTTTAALEAASPRSLHTAVWTGLEMIVWGGCNQSTNFCDVNSGGRYNPFTDSWTETSTAGAAEARMNHTAVWTGSEMIVWGGCSVGSQGNNFCNIQRNDGGVYDPASNTWQPMATAGAPEAREYHRAVWTGDVMVVWGGYNLTAVNTGGRYDPVSNTWQPTSLAGAPQARANHSLVWTGSEAIAWGGCDNSLCTNSETYFNSGGRYNPVTDTWTATNATGAPEARSNHTAVWTGGEMIVWGGRTASTTYLNSGSRYDPAADTWTPTGTAGAPPGKSYHHALWTGSEMIVWGGGSEPGMGRSGGRYDPVSDTWVPTSTNDPIFAKERHTAVWTGTEMLIWGGSTVGYGEYFGFGIRFNAVTGEWSLMSDLNEPEGRFFHNAVWTGTEMIVWGGQYGTWVFDTGGRYNPVTDSWTPTSVSGAPEGRAYHAAVWSGSEMIVWGGATYTQFQTNTGGRYNPSTNTWATLPTAGAPSPRAYLNGAWTGSEMIVWGGVTETGDTNTGGRYNPSTNAWTATSTAGAPLGRHFNTALWTGSELIVWGGMSGDLDSGVWYNSGGRYDPASNTWSATSLAGAPSERIWHVEVWTGEEMIVWGGCTGTTSCPNEVYTGGRYDPAADTWTSTSLQSVPSQRANAAAAWTGSDMIVWGGLAGNVGTYTTSGGFYHVSDVTNTPPVALPDNYSTPEDILLNVPAPGVLGNDTDPDGNPLSALVVTLPAHGALQLYGDGSFSYTPEAEFSGSDSFTYQVYDGISLGNIASVSLAVSPVNDLPVAAGDHYLVNEDSLLTVDSPGILGNDSDLEGDPLAAVLETGPVSGTLTLSAEGGFTYMPEAGYTGEDRFTYRASDGAGWSEIATVTLSVGAINDAPLALDDSVTTAEDTPLLIPVLENDTDPDNTEIWLADFGPASLGSVTISSTMLLYTPGANLHGTDSFTYTITDGYLTGTAQVTVELTPVNDAPQALVDAYVTEQDVLLEVPAPGLLSNDFDLDGDSLSAILVTPPQHGTLTLNADGSFRYTPEAGFSGADQFTYRASDGNATSEVLAVGIMVEASPPPPAVFWIFLPTIKK